MARQFVQKKMSTRAQMLLTGALTITLGFVMTIGVLSWQSSSEQKTLAENYLQQGQSALQSGNLDNASAALGKDRALRPQAPAMTSGLDDAIAKARVAELAAAGQTQQAAQQAA